MELRHIRERTLPTSYMMPAIADDPMRIAMRRTTENFRRRTPMNRLVRPLLGVGFL
jgi:hypothetical protein